MKISDSSILVRAMTEIPRAAIAGDADKDERGRLEVYEALISALGPESATNSGEASLLRQIYAGVRGVLESSWNPLPYFHWSLPLLRKMKDHLEKILPVPTQGIEGTHSAATVY